MAINTIRLVTDELKRNNVLAYQTKHLGSGHIRISWGDQGTTKSVVVSRSPSNVRAERAIRADVRRQMRSAA